MDTYCPSCNETMAWHDSKNYYCQHCAKHFEQLALCPECNKPVERLQACGAVNYLCMNGHGMISKKRVKLNYQPVIRSDD